MENMVKTIVDCGISRIGLGLDRFKEISQFISVP